MIFPATNLDLSSVQALWSCHARVDIGCGRGVGSNSSSESDEDGEDEWISENGFSYSGRVASCVTGILLGRRELVVGGGGGVLREIRGEVMIRGRHLGEFVRWLIVVDDGMRGRPASPGGINTWPTRIRSPVVRS